MKRAANYNYLDKGYDVGGFNVFRFEFVCFVVSMSDLLHDVDAIHGKFMANVNWQQHLKIYSEI